MKHLSPDTRDALVDYCFIAWMAAMLATLIIGGGGMLLGVCR